MTTPTYSNVLPYLEQTDPALSDADILALFKPAQTVSNVPLDVVTELFRTRLMMLKTAEIVLIPNDPDNPADYATEQQVKWEGTFMNMYFWIRKGTAPDGITAEQWAALNVGVTRFYSHVTDSRTQSLNLADPAIFAEFAALMTIFAGQTHPVYGDMPSLEDFQSIVAAAGGMVNASLQESDIAAFRTQYTNQQAEIERSELRASAFAPYNAAIASEKARHVAATASLKALKDVATNTLETPEAQAMNNTDFAVLVQQVIDDAP